jgi:hypothetical protein
VSGPEPTSIVFIGFMGAGKSSAARAAARVLGADFLDTDDLIAAEIPGGSIAGFFREQGEARFRELEERIVLEALERPGAVVALGGGAVESERVRAALAGHVTAWCRVEEEVSWEDRLDGRLAGAVASIQSVKGVAIGEAWDVAGRPGSEAHDEIFWSEKDGYFRETNHAGGLEGGMTNGQPLSVRAAIKPISTLTKPLRSVDTETKQPAQALRERTDSTVVPAAAVVAEAMVALTLARAYREKFGGDHIDDVLAALDAYKQRIDFKG